MQENPIRWNHGSATIDSLLKSRNLERISGSAANGAPWIERARKTLATAGNIADSDPSSAHILAYDAARYACAGVLAHQGLRATTAGGHYAIERAVRAQFGDSFLHYGTLRRRRNELEYPLYPDGGEEEEISEALETSESIVDSCGKLIPNLGIY